TSCSSIARRSASAATTCWRRSTRSLRAGAEGRRTLEPSGAADLCTGHAAERPVLRLQRRCQARPPARVRVLVRAWSPAQPPHHAPGHGVLPGPPPRDLPRARPRPRPPPRPDHEPAGDPQVPAVLELPDAGRGAARRSVPLLGGLCDGVDGDLAHAAVPGEGAAARIVLRLLLRTRHAPGARRRGATGRGGRAADPP